MTQDTLHAIPPAAVHAALEKWMLADGLPIVYDQKRSHGSFLVDAISGAEYLDLFSFFASLPLGHNHPGLNEPAFREKLMQAALVKPTNSDIYTEAMAEFVETFSRTLPAGFKHLFFIEGGALAVENALKVAFDWKVRKNLAAGRGELGSRIIHFKMAFHGRSGYTLSLTNTFSRDKTRYFPKFDWPRISAPGRSFPEDAAALKRVGAAEAKALDQIRQALQEHPHDVAGLIIETIQGEGGDVHFRTEFLQALRDLCDEQEMLLIFDEVQCGMGLTGRWWAFEHQGVQPDIFSFGKKSQVCGIAANGRVDDVDSCFKVSSRINSTWGGNLVDMVRCTRYVEIIEQQGLLQNARDTGSFALRRLQEVEGRQELMSNTRGRGLMCAFDLPDSATRDRVRQDLMARKVLMLPCGTKSLRFRPVLDFHPADVELAVERIEQTLKEL